MQPPLISGRHSQPMTFSAGCRHIMQTTHATLRDHFVNAPSQWEMTLHCNVVSHWLGAYTKWSLKTWIGPCSGEAWCWIKCRPPTQLLFRLAYADKKLSSLLSNFYKNVFIAWYLIRIFHRESWYIQLKQHGWHIASLNFKCIFFQRNFCMSQFPWLLMGLLTDQGITIA